jgi:acyloxyacyl hydrolase
MCTDDPGQGKCRVYPTDAGVSIPERAQALRRRHPLLNLHLLERKICDLPGIKEICKILDNVFNNEFPLVDIDQDHFGTETTFRGSSWRGKDCNDVDGNVHPGARAIDGDASVDHNCNGIVGSDSASGLPYENEYCDDSKRLGIAVLGDSLSAHFHIPEQWLDAQQFSSAAFEHLGFILENELDWPQMSASTGHVNVSWPNIEGRSSTIRTMHNCPYCVTCSYPRADTIALLSSIRS